jgi:hypothetical protein
VDTDRRRTTPSYSQRHPHPYAHRYPSLDEHGKRYEYCATNQHGDTLCYLYS